MNLTLNVVAGGLSGRCDARLSLLESAPVSGPGGADLDQFFLKRGSHVHIGGI